MADEELEQVEVLIIPPLQGVGLSFHGEYNDLSPPYFQESPLLRLPNGAQPSPDASWVILER